MDINYTITEDDKHYDPKIMMGKCKSFTIKHTRKL